MGGSLDLISNSRIHILSSCHVVFPLHSLSMSSPVCFLCTDKKKNYPVTPISTKANTLELLFRVAFLNFQVFLKKFDHNPSYLFHITSQKFLIWSLIFYIQKQAGRNVCLIGPAQSNYMRTLNTVLEFIFLGSFISSVIQQVI